MTINLKQTIGIQVRTARNGRGLTQEELAEQIDMTTETVSNIERGCTLPEMKTLDRLSRSLEIPLLDFFGDETEFSGASLNRVKMEMKIREIARHLSDSDLEVAVKQIEALSNRSP